MVRRINRLASIGTALLIPVMFESGLIVNSLEIDSEVLIAEEKVKPYETFLNRGRKKLKDHDYLGAIKDFTKAIDIDANDWRSYHNRALSKEGLKDNIGAISDYSKAIDFNSQPWSLSFYGRAINKQQIGNIEGAISDYSMAIDLGLPIENKSMAYYFRAVLKDKKEDSAGAINDYTKAIEFGLNKKLSVFAYFFRGFHKNILSDFPGAIEDFSKVIKFDLDDLQIKSEAYHNRGLAKSKLGEFKSAIEDFDKALELNPKNESTKDFRRLANKERKIQSNSKIIAINKKVKVAKEKNDYLEVIRLMKLIIETGESDIVGSYPYYEIAYNYDKLEDYNNAIKFYRKAISIEELKSGNDSIKVANYLTALAHTFNKGEVSPSKNDFNEVERIRYRVVEITKSKLGLSHIETAASYQNLAALFSGKGDFNESIKLRKVALEIAERVDDNDDWYEPIPIYRAFLYSQIATDYHRLGDHRNGKSNTIKAYNIRKSLLDEDSPLLADSYFSLGINSFYSFDFKEAKNFFNDAQRIYKIDRKEYKFELDFIKQMKKIISALEKLSSNKDSQIANNILIDQIPEDDPEATLKLQVNGSMLQMVGSFEASITAFEKAKKIHNRMRGSNNFDMASIYKSLGLSYLMVDDLLNAEKNLLAAIEIYKSLMLDSIISQDLIGLYDYLALLYALKESPEETKKFLEKAIDGSVLYIQEQAQHLPIDQRLNFSKAISGSYLASFAGIGFLPNGEELALKARLNRQGLLEEIEKYQSRLPLLDKSQRDKVAELNALNIQFSDRSIGIDERNEIRAKKQRIEEELFLQLPELKPQIVEVGQIANSLPKNSLLIEFQKFRPFQKQVEDGQFYGEPKYLALVLRPNRQIVSIDLGFAKSIEEKINKASVASEKQLPNALSLWGEVGELLIQPLAIATQGADTWFVSPDAEINRIPFAALRNPRGDGLLGEGINLRLITTGRSLLKLIKDSGNSDKESLVFANPSFSLEKKLSTKNQNRDIIVDQKRSSEVGQRNWIALPGTANEGKQISQLINAKLYTKEEATSLSIQQSISPQTVHIATHAAFEANQNQENKISTFSLDSSNPLQIKFEGENPLLRSYIVLAGANEPESNPKDDGYLTAQEITQLDWEGTEMVVISGCESGKGDIQSGEGVYGLKRAIAVAGARSSLLSLWKVDDRATAAFMTSFYKKLKAGEGRADALASTQKEFRNHPIPGWRHPYVWAAFQLSGDWRPIDW